jgi:hypothetical protein
MWLALAAVTLAMAIGFNLIALAIQALAIQASVR